MDWLANRMILPPWFCFNSLELAVGQATGNADGGWLNDSNLTAGGANSMQVATVLHDCFPCPIRFFVVQHDDLEMHVRSIATYHAALLFSYSYTILLTFHTCRPGAFSLTYKVSTTVPMEPGSTSSFSGLNTDTL